MKFNICCIEPQGYPWGHFLDDGCRIFCYALESLGHSCVMCCNQVEPDRINIVFGGHLLSKPEQVDAIAGACEYIAIQHEILNINGINLTGDVQRLQQVYLPFLRRASIVWEGIPQNLEPLRQLGIRSAFFRGGYHPWLRDVRPKRDRDIDFLFYGSITPHRQHLLRALSDRGHKVVGVFDTRPLHRNDLIARTKVHLAPVQGSGMEHFAYGRVGYLLNNHGLVVVERCQNQEWLEHCFITASERNWVDICEQTLMRKDRDEICDEFSERFQHLPFTDQMQHDPLESSPTWPQTLLMIPIESQWIRCGTIRPRKVLAQALIFGEASQPQTPGRNPSNNQGTKDEPCHKSIRDLTSRHPLIASESLSRSFSLPARLHQRWGMTI
jgi:hypothetical protein